MLAVKWILTDCDDKIIWSAPSHGYGLKKKNLSPRECFATSRDLSGALMKRHGVLIEKQSALYLEVEQIVLLRSVNWCSGQLYLLISLVTADVRAKSERVNYFTSSAPQHNGG